ncbi:MAG: NifB/NifX family molybdenum-iron cluster-binding protein [Thermoplasmata archaeon]
MKVCVPTSGRGGIDDRVSEHFGRSPTFTVVDTKSEKVDVVDNTSEHMGGMGKPPEQIAQAGAQVLVCSGLGPRAISMFESYGIEVYVGAQGSVRQAIEMWRSGRLQRATDENACREHRH